MDDQNKNLILATVLSFLVILGWFVAGPMLFPQWFPEPTTEATAPAATDLVPPTAADATAVATTEVASTEPLPESPRLTIETPKLSGSISMLGGRLDMLSLKTYRETIEPDSPIVQLLSPVGQEFPYYAVFGWAPGGGLTGDDVPGAKSEWKIASGGTLAPGQPVTLHWENGKGLNFTRTITVDEDFMFTVTDAVENTGTTEARLAPYGIVARHDLPKMQNIYVVHEGMIARNDGKLEELKYSKFASMTVDEKEGGPALITESTTDGWIGFTDHYWMTTLIPEQGKPFKSVAKYVPGANIYQVEVRQPAVTVAPGGKAESSTRLFAGRTVIHVLADQQPEGFAPAPGGLEDVYFSTLAASKKAA